MAKVGNYFCLIFQIILYPTQWSFYNIICEWNCPNKVKKIDFALCKYIADESKWGGAVSGKHYFWIFTNTSIRLVICVSRSRQPLITNLWKSRKYSKKKKYFHVLYNKLLRHTLSCVIWISTEASTWVLLKTEFDKLLSILAWSSKMIKNMQSNIAHSWCHLHSTKSVTGFYRINLVSFDPVHSYA